MSFIRNMFGRDVKRQNLQQYLESAVIEQQNSFSENSQIRAQSEPNIYMEEEKNNNSNLDQYNLSQSSFNITSIVNAPRGNAEKVLGSMRGIMSSGFTTIQGSFTKKNNSSLTVAQTLTLKDFEPYMAKLQSFKNELKNSQEKREEHKKMTLEAAEKHLKRCFEIIPLKFFDENYVDLGELLSEDILTNEQNRCEYQSYLERVESNSLVQIETKFEQFLDIMTNLHSIQTNVNKLISGTKLLRIQTREEKTQLLGIRSQIIVKKHKQNRMESAYQLMLMLQTFRQAKDNINEQVKVGNYLSA
jgi:hypothetical protein